MDNFTKDAFMNGGPIDASVGLTFSLRLFATYQQSGLLYGLVRNVPGIRGQCKAYIELDKGQVMSCYLEDGKGHRYSSTKADLCRLDEEKGPFEWSLQPRKIVASNTTSPLPPQTPRPEQKAPVPHRLVQRLDASQLQMYTSWQRTLLLTVFSLIDGKHTLEEIAARAQMPTMKVEEALHVLVLLKVINLY
jgi:hypothetical protein